MKRNSFIQRIVIAWGAIISLPLIHVLIQYLIPPEKATGASLPIRAGTVSEFSDGSVRLIRDGKHAVFVRQTSSGQIRSVSARCTHLGCLVEYLDQERLFRCNCHGSTFDPDGNNLTGPAVRPLPAQRVEVRGDDVYIDLS